MHMSEVDDFRLAGSIPRGLLWNWPHGEDRSVRRRPHRLTGPRSYNKRRIWAGNLLRIAFLRAAQLAWWFIAFVGI